MINQQPTNKQTTQQTKPTSEDVLVILQEELELQITQKPKDFLELTEVLSMINQMVNSGPQIAQRVAQICHPSLAPRVIGYTKEEKNLEYVLDAITKRNLKFPRKFIDSLSFQNTILKKKLKIKEHSWILGDIAILTADSDPVLVDSVLLAQMVLLYIDALEQVVKSLKKKNPPPSKLKQIATDLMRHYGQKKECNSNQCRLIDEHGYDIFSNGIHFLAQAFIEESPRLLFFICACKNNLKKIFNAAIMKHFTFFPWLSKIFKPFFNKIIAESPKMHQQNLADMVTMVSNFDPKDDYSTMCSICFIHLFPDELLLSNCCKKIFHIECLMKWYRSKMICPCCRSKEVFHVVKN